MFIGLLTLCFAVDSCSRSAHPGGNPALEAAVEDYVSGKTERAAGEFERLVRTLEGDDLALAYLYLGRCRLDAGELEKAAEAFTSGAMLDPYGPFEAYLEKVRRKAVASSRHLTEAKSLTRAELACVLVRLVPAGVAPEELPPVPRDCKNHWARKEIVAAIAGGYMDELPDGRFHPAEKVTRAAFLFVSARMISRLSGGRIRIRGAFPGGIAMALQRLTGASIGADPDAPVTGAEVAEVLKALQDYGTRNAE